MNQNKLETICVYCGSSSGLQPEYMEAAKSLGEIIAIRRLSLVYGGSNIGLMGIVANAVLENGGKVVGVIPNLFAEKIVHRKLTRIYQVGSMHERKHKMFELSDGFIALPGGLGTVEEILEIWGWAQLGIHQKPCGFLNTNGYYNKLLEFFDHATSQGFFKPQYRNIIRVVNKPEELLNQFQIK
ncbi:TPA: TIGR00730 family Rossman fold protein [Candidatus Poribacteria bacterium]|nr:TIGR00730 family Rossman fold protein [Candidatus Poribacteria bacterium]HIC19839.1 TIGR00730 family Rossman fold protein [Candidatus Poribacteria bacterium]HIM10963.1 TIGR00730 family Rossman fold protein [Candidatus Poribacteria bacterium]HIN31335.1 TIGR00730 family Rossman fold protein [Candidatus Poribacteria bacterium]